MYVRQQQPRQAGLLPSALRAEDTVHTDQTTYRRSSTNAANVTLRTDGGGSAQTSCFFYFAEYWRNARLPVFQCQHFDNRRYL